MSLKLVVLVAACLVQVMCAPPAPATPSPLEQLQKNAEEFSKTFTEQLNSVLNSKNTQQLNTVLKDSSDAILKHVSELSTSLQGALSDADGKARTALEKARTELEKTTNELKKEHPELEQQAAAVRGRLQQAVQATLQHSQVLAQELGAAVQAGNDKLAPQVKAAYDDFIKQAQAVQDKLRDAAKQ